MTLNPTPDSDTLRLYKSPEGYATMQQFYDDALAKLPLPVESLYVETPFGRTHMLAAGDPDAPPLLLMQGLAGSAILWHQQFADFARQHRVYALDIVGQPGRSAPNPLSLQDDSYSQWLVSVLDALELPQADMAGVSLGGYTIFRVGIIAPERLRKAVLLSPMRLARSRVQVQRYIANGMRGDKGQDKLEDRLTVRDFATNTDSVPKQEYDRQLARAMALATKHYRLGLALGMREEQSRLGKFWTGLRAVGKVAWPMNDDELRRFESRGLVLLGEHEMLYDAQRAARRVNVHAPNLRAEIISGAGHAAIYDQPQVVNPLILAYLAE